MDVGFIIEDGVLTKYEGDEPIVSIPNGVTKIGDYAFYKSKNLTEVVLPESLKRIESGAFLSCQKLNKINIPSGVEAIKEEAFSNCISLKDVKVPEKTVISDTAFYGCKDLADENGFIIVNGFLFGFLFAEDEAVVPDTVKSISTNAFKGSSVKRIKLPADLNYLGAAFRGCNWLEEIEIPEGITALLPYTFCDCYNLKKIKLPNSLSTIGEDAFIRCVALEEIEIPSDVTSIGKFAFDGCEALRKLKLPSGIKNVPVAVCRGCTSLESVEIPEGIEEIEEEAFTGCTALKQIAIPRSVEKISDVAFFNCKSLEKVEIANENCFVDMSAFDGCESLFDSEGMKIIGGILLECNCDLPSITVPESVREIGPKAFREGYQHINRGFVSFRPTGMLKEIVIPQSVKVIHPFAFASCENLTSLTLEEGVETIGENAFLNCKSLESLTIPNSVKSIGTMAFSECKNLVTVRGCASVEDINLDAFLYCENLKEILIDEGNTQYSSVDGILYSADKTEIVYCPAAKALKEFTVPENVTAIADHAFKDCKDLEKVVIHSGVKVIGDEIFYTSYCSKEPKLRDIQIAIGAGETSIGSNVLGFAYKEEFVTYPCIPVTFPNEKKDRIKLALGFCQNHKMYSEEYAADYRKFAASNEKTLLKRAAALKLEKVEDYFTTPLEKAVGYKPDLTLKKPNELSKVEILEETVVKGTLDDLKAVLKTYKSFEITARALALAARYRGVDFVRVLAENGATFKYKVTSVMLRKYGMQQKTVSGEYNTLYYLMLVPKKLEFSNEFGASPYEYSPMYGVLCMNLSEELEAKVLPLEKRIEVAKFLSEKPKLGASLDEMLFFALISGEIEFADALMEMGANLQKTKPDFYSGFGAGPSSYLDVITSTSPSTYRTYYTCNMTLSLSHGKLLDVFERLDRLAGAIGKKLMLTQKLFDELNWTEEALLFAIENIDISKVNETKALEFAVSNNFIASLEKMAKAGFISRPAKRENLIEFARIKGKKDALAWLIDFKNRTVDVAAEEAAAEAKMMRALMENPNSVAALKKIWSYKKLDDGTLIITNYKGNDTEVFVPAKIGKDSVSTIGKQAFSPEAYRAPANKDTRKMITSVTLPEGITVIENSAFRGCELISKITLPSTLKVLGSFVFSGCSNLAFVDMPETLESVGREVFYGCDLLFKDNFLILGGILFDCKEKVDELVIPSGVKRIARSVFEGFTYRTLNKPSKVVFPDTLEFIDSFAFKKTAIEKLELPASVKRIDEGAFAECAKLKEINFNNGITFIGKNAFSMLPIQELVIPSTVTEICDGAFDSCSLLRDVSIPSSVKHFGKTVFGWHTSIKFFHTVKGSNAEAYLKDNYGEAKVLFDYAKK